MPAANRRQYRHAQGSGALRPQHGGARRMGSRPTVSMARFRGTRSSITAGLPSCCSKIVGRRAVNAKVRHTTPRPLQQAPWTDANSKPCRLRADGSPLRLAEAIDLALVEIATVRTTSPASSRMSTEVSKARRTRPRRARTRQSDVSLAASMRSASADPSITRLGTASGTTRRSDAGHRACFWIVMRLSTRCPEIVCLKCSTNRSRLQTAVLL